MSTIYQKLLARCQFIYPRFVGQWQASRELFGSRWEEDFSAIVGPTLPTDPDSTWDEVLEGYAEFCTEALRAQVYFERTGRYKATSYAEVNAACYQDESYMLRRYLPGLFLSHFVWPHHYRLVRGFTDVILPQVPADVRTFYEIGVGCALYSLLTLRARPELRGVGYDISDHALKYGGHVIHSHALDDRFVLRNQDIITHPIADKTDFIISQEVLEHLEDPPAFIRGLLEATRPGGWGYITAAINAGHTDHIYLYRSPEEVAAHINGAGWEIVDSQSESNYMEKPAHLRPTVAGFLVRRPA